MRDIFKGSTSHSEYVVLVDSSTGLPKTGIADTSVTGSYVRTRGTRTAITMSALGSANAAYSSGGWFEVDATNQPGLYRIDVPDNAFATGADQVYVTVKATGCKTETKEFRLIDWNNQVAAIPNAVAGAAGGVFIAGSNAATTANITGNLSGSVGSVASGGITAASFAAGAIDAAAIATDALGSVELAATAVNEIRDSILSDGTPFQGARIDAAISSRLASGSYTSPPSAATIAAAVWEVLTNTLASAGSIGKLLVDTLDAAISSRLATSGYTAPLSAAGVRSAVGLASANLDTQLDALPTAGENASQVRTELTTELNRIDAAISSRSTYAGGAVASVTGNVGGSVVGSVGSLAAQAKTDVNAEVVDALSVDTYAQPGQETPAATATLAYMLRMLYKALRNKHAQTANQFSLYNDDATTIDQKASISADGTTTTVGELTTGP